MKTLDTDTVLTIIQMIDNKLRNFERGPLDGVPDDYTIGEEIGIKQIRDHLQEYIEGLVSQAENNLNAGE